MKKRNKINNMLILVLVLVAMLTSCEEKMEVSPQSNLDDQALIEAIMMSDSKISISADELPATSASIIEDSYVESYTSAILMASDMGYEVSLRKFSGSTVGEEVAVYFAGNGRMLSSAESDDDSDTAVVAKRHRMRHKECFDLIFPVSFTMPDSSTITLENEEGWETIKNWYTENPDNKTRAAIQFPVDVVFAEGDSLTIASDDEMRAARDNCAVDKRHKKRKPRGAKCFELVYPVDFTMADGTIITVSEKDSVSDLKAWHNANPDVKERPTYVYPIQVVLLENDSLITVADEDEMKVVQEYCGSSTHAKGKRDKGSKGVAPFTLVYPVSYTMPDSSVLVVDSAENKGVIKDWYVANPDVKVRAELVYPVDVLLSEDGAVQTVADEDEMKALKESFAPMGGKSSDAASGKKGKGSKGGKKGGKR